MILALNIIAALYALLIALAVLLNDREGFATPMGAIVRGFATLSLLWLGIYAVWGAL